MRKRVAQAFRSVLRRGQTADSQDRLQQTIIKLKRELPFIGEGLLQFFQQNHYTEWTSALADLMAECLEDVMELGEIAHMDQMDAVSLVFCTV